MKEQNKQSEMTIDEMRQYMELGQKKEELFNALESNSGMKGILNVAYTFLENPIIVCDTSFSVLENCPEHHNETDFEIRNHKQYMRPEAVDSMHKEGLVERIFASRKPFAMYRENLKTEMVYCRIMIQKSVVGYICVICHQRPLKKADYELISVLSQMLSVEMQKNSFFTEKAGFKYEYFLSDLIEGNVPDKDFTELRMIQLGRKPTKYYWILALSFGNRPEAHIIQHYYLDQIITILKNSMAFFYEGKIVVLLGTENPWPYEEADVLKLTDYLEINEMHMAISHYFSDLMQAPLHYRQALHLIKLADSVCLSQRIFRYEDYAMECMAMLFLNTAEQRAMIHPDLIYLINYDRDNKTEYFKTLKAYIENDRNALRTAAWLHIHKSTFFYRMGKIYELLHLKPDDGRRLFNYEASVRLLNVLDGYDLQQNREKQ